MILTGCMQSGPTVVTFEVADQGTYKIELITDEQIQHVKDLMAGSEEGRIPVGTIVARRPRCQRTVVVAHRPRDPWSSPTRPSRCATGFPSTSRMAR